MVAEVLQETYLAVWRSAGSQAQSSSTSGSAVGWLWTIAAHRLIDAFRHRARRERIPSVQTFETVAPAAEDEALAGGMDANLERALHALPPSYARCSARWSSTG